MKCNYCKRRVWFWQDRLTTAADGYVLSCFHVPCWPLWNAPMLKSNRYRSENNG